MSSVSETADDGEEDLSAISERRVIVEKYSTGSRLISEDWENPQYSIYATTDYYGFIHDGHIPSKHLTMQSKIRKNDVRREVKWRKMIFGKGEIWLKLFSNGKATEKLTQRVFKGIPQSFRMQIWPMFLDIENIKKTQAGVYAKHLNNARTESLDIRQIDLDVNRTFRDTTFFRDRYGERQRALFHVLTAYSMFNTEIGYCQGMSELAGLMLIYLTEEEDAFWALSQLMQASKWNMHGLFVRNFPKLLRLFQHHEHILASLLPRVNRHLVQNDIPTSLYALKWFMQCFLHRVPMSLCLRLWDIYLLEGERVLIAMAYNIIKMHKRRLMKMDQNQLCNFLQIELARDFLYDDDTVIDSLKDCMEELRKVRLDHLPAVVETAKSVEPANRTVSGFRGNRDQMTPPPMQVTVDTAKQSSTGTNITTDQRNLVSNQSTSQAINRSILSRHQTTASSNQQVFRSVGSNCSSPPAPQPSTTQTMAPFYYKQQAAVLSNDVSKRAPSRHSDSGGGQRVASYPQYHQYNYNTLHPSRSVRATSPVLNHDSHPPVILSQSQMQSPTANRKEDEVWATTTPLRHLNFSLETTL